MPHTERQARLRNWLIVAASIGRIADASSWPGDATAGRDFIRESLPKLLYMHTTTGGGYVVHLGTLRFSAYIKTDARQDCLVIHVSVVVLKGREKPPPFWDRSKEPPKGNPEAR